MDIDWFGDKGVIGSMGQLGQLGYGMYNSEREAKYVKELLDWKKKEGSVNMAMKEMDAYRAANKSNQFAAAWKNLDDNPNSTIDERRAQNSARADLYGDANANGVVQNLNGSTTDLVPGGVIPQQYVPVTTPAPVNTPAPVATPGPVYTPGPVSTPGPMQGAGIQQPQSTVAAGPAKPVTQPASSSAFVNKRRPNQAYVG